MDAETSSLLARLLRAQRVAALGTLRGGAPFVSMTLFLPGVDFTTFHLHISRLAWHTQDLLADPRASLSIAEADDGRADPQSLARLGVRGEAVQIANASAGYGALKAAWLARFPASAANFELADFSFWRIDVREARFVASFGRIHNLSAADLAQASSFG